MSRAGLALDELKVAPVEFGAAESVITAVEAGWGISWVSKVAAGRALELRRIAVVEVEGLRLHRTTNLVRHRARIETNAHRKFYAFVRSEEGEEILRSLGVLSGAAYGANGVAGVRPPPE